MNPFSPPDGFDWGVSASFHDLYPSTNASFGTPHPAPPGEETLFSTASASGSLGNVFSSGLQSSGQFDRHHTESSRMSLLGNSTALEQNPATPGCASRTVSRRSKYQDLDWDKYKVKIQELYLTEDRTLQETMRIMREAYFFDASQKLYKEKFRLWRWQKNLPGDHAKFMVTKANKRQQENNKETIFIYGGSRWTKEQAEASAGRTKKGGNDSEVIPIETPPGITYQTPEALRNSEQRDLGLSPKDAHEGATEMEGILTNVSPGQAEDESESESDDSIETQALLLSWNGHTRSDLKALFEAAQSAQRSGEADAAEEKFRTVLDGYEHILSPTHEDTNKVAYALATFYAEQDHMIKANEVLETVTQHHIDQHGAADKRTQQHILSVVELLHVWNRSADALAFLASAKNLLETITRKKQQFRRKRKLRKRGKDSLRQNESGTSNLQSQDIDAITYDIIKDADPATIKYGLGVARAHVRAKDEAVENLLRAIIRYSEEGGEGLIIESLEGRAELLRLYQSLDKISQNFVAIKDAWTAVDNIWAKYEWDEKAVKSLQMMEACMKLACAFLKCGFEDESRILFRRVDEKAANLYGASDERTIWILISIGLVYQNNCGWDQAKQWFQQALAFAYDAYPEKDGIIVSLEASMDKHHFSYVSDEGRPYKTVFGVNGIVIRPGRLHIE